jgi:RTX calcium-binding nonapeptide repeat (4 copies)
MSKEGRKALRKGLKVLVAAGAMVAALATTAQAAVFIGNGGDNVLNGTPGDDQLYGRRGDDVLLGRRGDDFLKAGFGHDDLYGGWGNDTLKAGFGNDRLIGGPPRETGDGQSDLFNCGPGFDVVREFEPFLDEIVDWQACEVVIDAHGQAVTGPPGPIV